MRRLLVILNSSLLVVGAVAANAQDGEPIFGLITVDRADVRIGPDFAYDAVGQLPLNASVVGLRR